MCEVCVGYWRHKLHDVRDRIRGRDETLVRWLSTALLAAREMPNTFERTVIVERLEDAIAKLNDGV